MLSIATLAAAPSAAVFVVAGQSNALNWHAAAAALPSDEIDTKIAFYYLSGAPFDRGFEKPVNSSSQGEWLLLSPQRQEPFVRYEAEFFGPEITLARRLAHAGVNPMAVIKIAFFGTSLAEDWRPDAKTGNQLYVLLQREIATALEKLRGAGQPCHVAGFFWMQGETDAVDEASALAYGKNLSALISAVRRDFSTPDLPFILGRIGPPPPNKYRRQHLVREAQTTIIAATPMAAWVNTDDLARDTDGIHLLAAGVMTLGERWAESWLRLKRSPQEASDTSSPEPAPTP